MIKDDFDRLFDQAFDEAAMQHTAAPEPHASWEQMAITIKKRNRNVIHKRYLPYIAVSFVLGGFIFGSSGVSKAVTPFINTVKTLQEGAVSFIFGSRESNLSAVARTAPPPDVIASADAKSIVQQRSVMEKKYTTWESATPHVSFASLSIGYVPSRYELTEVRLYASNENDKAEEAILLYANDKLQRYVLSIKEMQSTMTLTAPDHVGRGIVETVTLPSGLSAYLMTLEDQRISLDYMFNRLLVSITGDISKQDALKIAQHIEQLNKVD